MKNKIMYSALLVLMLLVSACGSATPTAMANTAAPVVMPVATDTPASAAMPVATATMAPPAMPSGPTVVTAGLNAVALGSSILIGPIGMTLYIYTKDTPNTSNCYGNCATNWPPLLTNGAPIASTGVTASMLGTTTRTDGTVQVTYNGWPLYYFSKDKAPGDTTGEGVGSVWYVMTSDGTQK